MRLLQPSSRTINRNSKDYLKVFFNSILTTSDDNKDAKSETTTSNSASASTSTSTLLYRRRPSGAFFPRAILTFSTLHTGYWSWYVFDFTPYVQQVAASVSTDVAAAADAAATSTFTTDNTVGYLGLGLAIFMSIGSVIFPQSLIQEIQLENRGGKRSGQQLLLQHQSSSGNDNDIGNDGGENQNRNPSSSLLVRTYGLPFVTPSSITKYPLGNIVIDSPGDMKKIITDYGGNIGCYSGYLPIHAEGKRINLLLQLTDSDSTSQKGSGHDGEKDSELSDIENNGDEIYEKDLLFKTLVPPKLLSVLGNGTKSSKKASNSGNRAKALTKKQKRMERRLLRRR